MEHAHGCVHTLRSSVKNRGIEKERRWRKQKIEGGESCRECIMY